MEIKSLTTRGNVMVPPLPPALKRLESVSQITACYLGPEKQTGTVRKIGEVSFAYLVLTGNNMKVRLM